ncbi:MAG: hypothetical protein EXR21_02675 [Flavobacteriaceae bacterium]|nr:hypothetical protein [Flavobacteriaceae bacterium]
MEEKSCPINFEGYSFDLPIEVKKADSIFHLDFDVYSGFFISDSIGGEAQLDGYLIFPGNDNVEREYYTNHDIIGISFRIPIKQGSFDQIKSKLGENFGSKFIKKQDQRMAHFRFLKPLKGYYHLVSENRLNIVLKKIEDTVSSSNTITTISFYPEMGSEELIEYASWVN